MRRTKGLRGIIHKPLSRIREYIASSPKIPWKERWKPDAVFRRIFEWDPMQSVVTRPFPNFSTQAIERISQAKHEGSFYPAPLFISLLDALKAHKSGLSSLLNQTESLLLEEFLFPTWADYNAGQAGEGTGQQVVFHISQSSKWEQEIKMEADEKRMKWILESAVTPDQVQKILKMKDVYALKSISRHLSDPHGTRSYIRSLALKPSPKLM
eukprot:CAMPEP_0114531738 /NCGR_PEP_ID=MMETSP0109-20121206/26233_1 /TAXON_ID=29199 /ORGANISM="Chlorarachnion reptans, Strain CCCM449" /LENGTH=210 /DNA_ID=CAMNT_0001714637 /DNA_START=231 /DNA_END=863 /DNA_ORIENTATION=-